MRGISKNWSDSQDFNYEIIETERKLTLPYLGLYLPKMVPMNMVGCQVDGLEFVNIDQPGELAL